MTIQLKLSYDRSKLGPLGNKKLERAIVSALSKAGGGAARKLKAAAGRSVRQRKRIKVARVNRALPLIFPKGPKSISNLVWEMKVDSRPVPLASYPYRQTRKGVSVAVNKNGRKLIEGAFVATMRSGHTGIFTRTSRSRLPIKELYTTRVSDVFQDEGMVPAIQNVAQKEFSRAFAHLFKAELGK